jgi:hypothetical protein
MLHRRAARQGSVQAIDEAAIRAAQKVQGEGPVGMTFKKRKAGLSGKEPATDIPEWTQRWRDARPFVDETGVEFATRMMNKQYGAGNWTRKRPARHGVLAT